MERSLFFNSAPGDPRVYEASDFAEYFGSVLSTGLLHTDEIPGMSVRVSPGTLTTVVSPGKAIMLGKLYKNTSDLTLTHSIPEASLNRIDRIVLRHDLRNATRDINLAVKEGTPSSSPVAPALQRDNFIYELSLAQILVRANTSQLQQSDLVDERLNESLCGLVYSLISIPTEQFQRQWDEFIAGINDEGFATQADFANHIKNNDHVKWLGAAGGNKNNLELSSSEVTSYTDGLAISFSATLNSDAAVSVKVNQLGVVPLIKESGAAKNNIKKDSIYTARYSLSKNSFILQGEGGGGTAKAAQILYPETATTDTGEIVGSMVNRGGTTHSITAQGNSVTILEGYHNGLGKVTATYPVEKRATGTDSTSTSDTKVTARGLTFRPSFILVENDVYGRAVFYEGGNSSINDRFYSQGSSSGGASWQIFSDGFELSGLSNNTVTYRWIACG